MADGLRYVVGRIDWYMSLVKSLLQRQHGPSLHDHGRNELHDRLKGRIKDLYVSILTYEIQSVCYCYHDHPIVKALRAVILFDDWKGECNWPRVLFTKLYCYSLKIIDLQFTDSYIFV